MSFRVTIESRGCVSGRIQWEKVASSAPLIGYNQNVYTRGYVAHINRELGHLEETAVVCSVQHIKTGAPLVQYADWRCNYFI